MLNLPALVTHTPLTLDSCTRSSSTPEPPERRTNGTTTPTAVTAFTKETVVRSFAAGALIGAAISSASTGGGSLQVSLHAAASSRRVAFCHSEGNVGAIENTGTSVWDNPTRLEAGGEALGTIAGNTLLLVVIPLVLATITRALVVISRADLDPQQVALVAITGVHGALQIPSLAAATRQLVDSSSPSATAAGVTGLVVWLIPSAVYVAAYFFGGDALAGRPSPTSFSQRSECRSSSRDGCFAAFAKQQCFTLRRVYTYATSPRSRWIQPRRRGTATWKFVLQLCLHNSLCEYHHRCGWVLLLDHLSMAALGAFVGLAMAVNVSCTTVVAAAWSQVVCTGYLFVLAMVLRPRSRLTECAVLVMLNGMTFTTALLSALGLEHATDQLATAQVCVQMLAYLPPMCVLAAAHLPPGGRKRTAVASATGGSQSQSQPLTSRKTLVHPSFLEHDANSTTASSMTRLRELIATICARHQVSPVPQ